MSDTLRRGGSAAAGLVLLFVLALAAAAMPPAAAWADEPAAEAAAPSGLVKEGGHLRFYKGGTPVMGKWRKVGGARYYFDAKGNAVQGRSAKVGKSYWVFADSGKLLTPKSPRYVALEGGLYYVGKKGRPAKTGWIIEGKKLRYVAKSGKVKTSGEKQGIAFKKSGVAKNNLASKLKITVMKRIAAVTNPSWSKEQKLKACWQTALRGPHVNAGALRDLDNPGWVQRQAYRTMHRSDHDCFGATASFAMMAFELGYKPVVYAAPYIHAYAYIDGKLYDSASLKLHNMKGERKFIVDSYASGMPEKITRESQVRPPAGGNGWVTAVGNSYYFRNGKMVKGQWVADGGRRYYLGSSGKAVANGSFKVRKSNKSSEKAYFVFDKRGRLLSGSKARLVKVGGVVYGVTAKGAARTGWSSGKKRYFGKKGVLATGLSVVGGKLTVFSSSGAHDAAATSQLRKQAVPGARLADCLALLGEQTKKASPSNSCRASFSSVDGELAGFGTERCRTFGKAKVYTYSAPGSDVEYIVFWE